jgi:hypothetical protein
VFALVWIVGATRGRYVVADACHFGPHEGGGFGPDFVMHVDNTTVWFVDSTVMVKIPDIQLPHPPWPSPG